MTNFLYARVSTASQTLAHQLTMARGAGFAIGDDHVVADHGVSGAAVKFGDRPQARRLYDMLRRGDCLVIRWVDRLGRDYEDVTETIRAFMKRGVVIKTVINRMVFDGATADPMQMAVRDALIGFMAAQGQAAAEASKEAQRAGIAHKKATEGKTAYRGRKPSYTREQLAIVDTLLAAGESPTAIAKAAGLDRAAVYRIKADRINAEATLLKWEAA